MPAKKISVPVTPDMAKELDDLCELHALQLPSLASMLLRDALAGRRSALLPKRSPTQQGAAGAKQGADADPASQSEAPASRDSRSLLKGRANESSAETRS